MSQENQAVQEALDVYAPDTEIVPPGDKRSEVGLIPEGWRVTNLGNVITLQRGYDLPQRNRRSGPIPIVSSSGTCDTHSQSQVRGPGVVTGRYGTVGEVFFVREDFWPLNTTLFVSDFKGNNPLFISYMLRTIDFASHSGKSGVPGVNRNDLHGLNVVVPPVHEQRAIAAALSDVDALISSLDRLISKKRAVKTAAMQQLLTGKQRLPGFSGEWEMKRLGDVCEIVSGGTPSTSVPSFWTGEIPWCTPTDITKNNAKYLFSTDRTISPEGLKYSSAALLPRGALLLCTRATVGEIKIAAVPVCTNQGFKSLVCGSDLGTEFLYYKLVTLKDRLRELGVGSTFLEVSRKDVAALEIPLPQLEEQTAIAAVLSDMDAELSALEARREKTWQLKQGMMQELLTGRTRLRDRRAGG